MNSTAAFGCCQFVLPLSNDIFRRQNFLTSFRPTRRCRDGGVGLSGSFAGIAILRKPPTDGLVEKSASSGCEECTTVIGSTVSSVESRASRHGKSRDKMVGSGTYNEHKRRMRNVTDKQNRYEPVNGVATRRGEYRRNDRKNSNSSKPQWLKDKERMERMGIFGITVLEGTETERREIMEECARGKNVPTTEELNEVLTSLCRSRRMEDGHKIIEGLLRLPENIRKQLVENVKTYTIMIDICGKSRHLTKAFELFYGMQSKGLRPNAITYNSIIAACSRNNEAELAFEVFKEMEQIRVEPDKFTFGALIDSCAKTGKVDAAFELAELMDRKQIRKDATIYSALMDACGRSNQVERAFSVYMDMKKAGVFPNLITFSLLIDTCANDRNPESVKKAFQLFSEIRHWGFPHANVVVYTALINCCSKCGVPELGKKVLESMIADNVQPNAITFGAYIDGWSRAGRIDEAFEALRTMIRVHHCEPNAVLIGGLIDTARRTRQFYRAKLLWGVMVQFNVRISRIFYPSLMAMAAKNGDIDVAIGIAYYVLGTGHLRRCDLNSEDSFLRVLANSILFVRHAIDSAEDSHMRETRQARMAVLYESTAITQEQYQSIDPDRAFGICVSWGDLRTRDGVPKRNAEYYNYHSPQHRNGNYNARQAMILGREAVRAACSSGG